MGLTSYTFLIVALGIIAYISRVLPFAFANKFEQSHIAHALAGGIPLAIMTLLVSHGIVTSVPVPALVGIASTALTHHVFNKTIVSISVGTAIYMFIGRIYV